MQDHDLLEFEKLKDEQIGRLTYRDTLFYFTMVIIGGALTMACSEKDGGALIILLVLPFATFIAGVAHITCDRRIEDIGAYIRDHLAKAVAAKADIAQAQVFAWEIYFRSAPLHWWRKILQFIANQILYSFSGAGVLYFYLNESHCKSVYDLHAPEYQLWWLGMALMVVMFSLITIFSFFKWTPREPAKAKQVGTRLALRLVQAGIAAAVAAVAILGSARFAHGTLAMWASTPGWQVQPIHLAAMLAALLVWSFVLIATRR